MHISALCLDLFYTSIWSTSNSDKELSKSDDEREVKTPFTKVFRWVQFCWQNEDWGQDLQAPNASFWSSELDVTILPTTDSASNYFPTSKKTQECLFTLEGCHLSKPCDTELWRSVILTRSLGRIFPSTFFLARDSISCIYYTFLNFN